ncbi:jg20805 [Pararge aegeria aegeria]|uniref:Jg20805 protein n=1 Tax=Pararge aegeria aegeria TaxID=348720 RepID=A0A8S4R5R6_9NEOP|nr:jg20805 [Pararge aegeria aegeria]
MLVVIVFQHRNDQIRSDQIRSTQRASERSILKITKIHKVRSDRIRQKTKVTDALKQALKLKWQWAGHISRYADHTLTIQTTRWKAPDGKRDVGRPSKRWADDIKRAAGNDWMVQGKERKTWKRLGEAFTREGAHIS